MEIKQISPAEAFEILKTDRNAVYLDVRTAREFELGHPPGALNVPVVLLDPSGGPARPNERFLEIVREHVGSDAMLVVGCQSGMRSQRASEILVSAGYHHICNVQGGFGGSRDPSGRALAAGWRDLGLPVESGQPADRCYDALSAVRPKS